MSAITTKGLTKIYEIIEKEEGVKGSIRNLFKKKKLEKIAIKNFDLQIEEGEFIGLIGPNGAGKTTLIKMLTGIIYPTFGEVSVLGYKPMEGKDSFKKNFAVVMGQKSQLWWDLPAIDSFKLNKEIYGISEIEYRKKLSYFTELLQIEDILKVQVRNLSLGERMKMEFIAALLHNPKIIFLDEPTIGLDSIAQKEIRKFLKDLNENLGVTIILTSHYMEDIQHLCKRCVIVNHGEKIYDGSFEALLEKYNEYKTIVISFPVYTEIKTDIEGEWIEKSPYKAVIKVKKSLVKSTLQSLMMNYDIEDISILEEEIGSVIEKMYTFKVGGNII
ncbi:MAG TPA: ATP-binding cassette domain-containing protein [Clostridiaceae bacterium]